MPEIQMIAVPTEQARAFQRGEADAYGNAPERKVSDGSGVPCRHCLKPVAVDEPYLVLAYRPFPELQPYAETGPIFLHAEACEQAEPDGELPEIASGVPDYIVRGYGHDDRIVYGTGKVTGTGTIAARAEELLARPEIAYVHVRSSRNNCYQWRIERR
jgi:hypothetical protein